MEKPSGEEAAAKEETGDEVNARRNKGKQKIIDSEEEDESEPSEDEGDTKKEEGGLGKDGDEGKENEGGDDEEKEEEKTWFRHCVRVMRLARGPVVPAPTPKTGWWDLTNAVTQNDPLVPIVGMTIKDEGLSLDLSSWDNDTIEQNMGELTNSLMTDNHTLTELDASRARLSPNYLSYLLDGLRYVHMLRWVRIDPLPAYAFLRSSKPASYEYNFCSSFANIKTQQFHWQLDLVEGASSAQRPPSGTNSASSSSSTSSSSSPSTSSSFDVLLPPGTDSDVAAVPLTSTSSSSSSSASTTSDSLSVSVPSVWKVREEQLQKFKQGVVEFNARNREFRKLVSGEGETLDLRNFYMAPWASTPRHDYSFFWLRTYWFASIVDLSNNNLKRLPDHLKYCVHLRKFIASDNKLKKLPEFLKEASKLEVVVLRNNSFKRFPEPLVKISTLKRVDLRNNRVGDAPWQELRNLPRLKKIDLTDNGFNPKKMKKVVGLIADEKEGAFKVIGIDKTFWISRLVKTSNDNGTEKSKRKDKSGQSTSAVSVPQGLPYNIATLLTTAKVLDFRARNLHSEHMRALAATYVMLHSFNEREPAHAIPITVEEIDLSDNFIRDEGLVKLALVLSKNKTITRLDIRRNQVTLNGLSQLITTLAHNVFLRQLKIEDEDLKPMGHKPEDEEKQPKLNKWERRQGMMPYRVQKNMREAMDRIKFLLHSNAKFQRVLTGHSDVLDLQQRAQQDFNVNLLTKLTSLRVINMSYNNLRMIPGEIGQMTKLEQLILIHNQIRAVPTEISQVTNLEILDLTSNQLYILDPVVFVLPKLKHLLLARNRLVSLDWNAVCGVRSLQLLDLTENPVDISMIPSAQIKKRTAGDRGDDITQPDWSRFARLRLKGDEWLLVKHP